MAVAGTAARALAATRADPVVGLVSLVARGGAEEKDFSINLILEVET